MADSPEIEAGKRDGNYLRSILGIDKDGQHTLCPICKHESMRVSQDKGGSGAYLWQCMKGCGKGSVIDALIAVERKTLKEAMAEVQKKYGDGKPYQQNGRKPNLVKAERERIERKEKEEHEKLYKVYPEPIINLETANPFIDRALDNLIQRRDLQEKWLVKRQISLDVCKQYRVGFMDKFEIPMLGRDGKGDWNWRATNGWILPFTNVTGKLIGVKIHFEEAQRGYKGKSTWVKFGMYPAHDRNKNIMPNSTCVCLWPHPYQQQNRKLFKKFERDQNWWLSQAPEDILTKYQQLETVAKTDLAMSLKVAYPDLPPDAILQAQATAFESVKSEIIQAVIKKNNPNATDIRIDKENQDEDIVFIHPGELKALSMISSGFVATSVTSGEGSIPGVPAFACFKGRNVVIVRDDDEPKENEHTKIVTCTGRSFPQEIQKRLLPNMPRSVRVITFGRKER